MTAFTRAERNYIDKRVVALKRAVPAARVILLPGAGHFVFLSRAPNTLRELRQFLSVR